MATPAAAPPAPVPAPAAASGQQQVVYYVYQVAAPQGGAAADKGQAMDWSVCFTFYFLRTALNFLNIASWVIFLAGIAKVRGAGGLIASDVQQPTPAHLCLHLAASASCAPPCLPPSATLAAKCSIARGRHALYVERRAILGYLPRRPDHATPSPPHHAQAQANCNAGYFDTTPSGYPYPGVGWGASQPYNLTTGDCGTIYGLTWCVYHRAGQLQRSHASAYTQPQQPAAALSRTPCATSNQGNVRLNVCDAVPNSARCTRTAA